MPTSERVQFREQGCELCADLSWRAVHEEGADLITVRDFPDPENTYGRGRSWVSGELAALEREGVLERVGKGGRADVYRPRTAGTGTDTQHAA